MAADYRSRRGGLLALLLASVFLWVPVVSLAVVETSKCVDACEVDGSRKTTTDDLVCPDSAYTNTTEGEEMKKCLLCQSTGTTYISSTRNDMYTFLYNQKYTIQTCLFDRNSTSNGTTADCNDKCGPLESVFRTVWYRKDGFAPLFDYCSINSGSFEKYASDCASCLRDSEGSVILGNFMDTMESACEDKPNPEEGKIVNIRGDLFATTTGTPAATETSGTTPTGGLSTASATSTSAAAGADSSSDSSSEKSGSLSTGAAAGVGVGAGLGGVIVIVALVWVFWLRKRRARRNAEYEPEQMLVEPSPGKDFGPPMEMSAGAVQDQKKSELDGTPKAAPVELP